MKRFKKRWFLLLLLPPLVVLYFFIQPLAYLPHKHIVIALPFSAENDPSQLIPMGETIEHPKPRTPKGHPGIDFQWTQAVPIIASADGVVNEIGKHSSEGNDVFVRHNLYYETRYKEMENIQVKKGQKVTKGQILGYPHCTTFQDSGGQSHCQLHWEFASTSVIRDRFCPVTYFDDDSRRRIEAIWDKVPANNQFKRDFPDICSGDYKGAVG